MRERHVTAWSDVLQRLVVLCSYVLLALESRAPLPPTRGTTSNVVGTQLTDQHRSKINPILLYRHRYGKATEQVGYSGNVSDLRSRCAHSILYPQADYINGGFTYHSSVGISKQHIEVGHSSFLPDRFQSVIQTFCPYSLCYSINRKQKQFHRMDEAIVRNYHVLEWLQTWLCIGWLDLLTPYTHHSELQAITAPSLFPHFTVHSYTCTRILSLH
jgi:hypothetical protein